MYAQARMLASPAGNRRGFWTKAALAVGIALYVLVVAKSVAGASGPSGFHLPKFGLALAVAPIALFALLRAPIIFPFGLFLALMPFDPLLSVTSGATLLRVLGILTVVALVTRMLLTRHMLRLRPAWYVWLSFIAWCGLTMFWSLDFDHGRLIYGILAQNFGLMTVLAMYPITRRDFKTIVAIMVGAGVASVAYAVIANGGLGGGSSRLSIVGGNGNVVDQNFFATSFIVPLAFAFSVSVVTKRLWLRVVCWAATAALMLGVIVSGSRGAFIALGLMFVYFAVRSRSLTQVGLMVAGFVALLFRYPLVWERFLHDDGGGTGSGRTLIWQVGLQALRGHWLFGSGIGTFQEIYARVYLLAYQRSGQGWTRPAHNVLVGMSVELGIIGLGLLLAAWFMSFRSLRVIPRSSQNFGFRMAAEAAIVGLAVQSMFIDPMWLKFVWLGLSLPFLILNLERPERAFARRLVRPGFVPARSA